MALKDTDLLKFVKKTEFAVKLIEDESSKAQDGSTTVVKVLHLVNAVNAEGSIPTPDGKTMKVSGNKVYVAADNYDTFLQQAEVKDDVIVYTGDMHLDVSKPSGRTVNGEFVVTKPARIWLTATKFSRSGGQLSQQRTQNLNGLISKLFAGDKPLDLTAETGGTAAGEQKVEVVPPKKEKERKRSD